MGGIPYHTWHDLYWNRHSAAHSQFPGGMPSPAGNPFATASLIINTGYDGSRDTFRFALSDGQFWDDPTLQATPASHTFWLVPGQDYQLTLSP